jgi:hypothetical protein
VGDQGDQGEAEQTRAADESDEARVPASARPEQVPAALQYCPCISWISELVATDVPVHYALRADYMYTISTVFQSNPTCICVSRLYNAARLPR